VPRLLDFAQDGALDDGTRTWVFQALRDITGQSLPRDATLWRQWYASVKTTIPARQPLELERSEANVDERPIDRRAR